MKHKHDWETGNAHIFERTKRGLEVFCQCGAQYGRVPISEVLGPAAMAWMRAQALDEEEEKRRAMEWGFRMAVCIALGTIIGLLLGVLSG